MKLVIIEGPDNTGKTTLINELVSLYDNVYYMHCTKPKQKDPIKSALSQNEYFNNVLHKIKKAKDELAPDLLILDRSWVGEYVYGCKYRGNGEEFVIEMIDKCYEALYDMSFNSPWFKYYTILLTADNPDFCMKNDDGKSLSDNNIENIKDEIDRFNKIFSMSFNRDAYMTTVIVNDGDKFRPKEDILNDVLEIINY